MFEKDTYVVHGLKGVCKVRDISRLDFVKSRELYYTLVPVYDSQTLLYIPVNSEKAKLRERLSPQEARRWLEELPEQGEVWYGDDKERKLGIERAMGSGDQKDWSAVVNGIYGKKLQKLQSGKKFTDREREFFRIAGNLLLGEVASALGSDPGEIENLILEKMKEKEVRHPLT